MYETYTIQNVMPTGKTHPTYGREYYIKFVESEDTFTLWFSDKNKPEEGKTIEGQINGSKFTKAPRDYTPNDTTNVTKKEWTPKGMRKDNSDGMRQGMCFNNAANYVNSCATEIVKPEVWAETVYNYANALYLKGDLGQVAEPAAPAEPENSGDLFGGKPPKK